MQDIALAPEYGGVVLIIGLQVAMSAVLAWMVLQKFTFVNVPEGMSWLWSLVTGILAIAFLVAGVGVFVKWLVKSLLVKWLCNSQSGWNFRTAAAVTGYAYLADFVFTVVTVPLIWFWLPQFAIDVSNPDAARQAIASYNAQLGWQRFLVSLPLGFVGLAWKSFLGAVGTRFGTKEKCSFGTGFIVFFVLGLVGLLLGLIQ